MTKETKDSGVDRRGLLGALGKGIAGTAAVAAGAVTAAAPTTAVATELAAERTKKRYRETDHVKAYYRTNRY